MIRSFARCLPGKLRLIACSSAIAGAMLLSGCKNASSAGGNGDHPEIVQMHEDSFAKLWTTQLNLQPKDSIDSIWVCDDSIHIYTKGHFDHALKRSDGDLLFFNHIAAETPDTDLRGGPVILTDKFAVPTTYTLEVYNKRGRFIRSVQLGLTVTSGAVGSGNMVYLGADRNNGEIAAIDVTQPYNVVRWEKMTMGGMLGAPAVYDNNIFFPSNDGSVRACDDIGTGIWPLLEEGRFKTGEAIVADLKADKYGVYVASTDGRLYVLNRQSGKLKWQYFSPTALKSGPEVTDTMVYQFVPGYGLAALVKIQTLKLGMGPDDKDVDNPVREPVWIAKNAVKFLAEDKKYSYVLGTDNKIMAVEKSTGAVAFKSNNADFAAYGTNTKDNIIYAVTASGNFYAIQPVLKPGVTGEEVFNQMQITPALASAR